MNELGLVVEFFISVMLGVGLHSVLWALMFWDEPYPLLEPGPKKLLGSMAIATVGVVLFQDLGAMFPGAILFLFFWAWWISFRILAIKK